MSGMVAIDTNVLVRLLTGDDSQQAASAEQFVCRGAWVSILALAEVTWVLTTVYELRPADVARAVGMLLDHEHLTLQDSDVVAAALKIFQSNARVGFSDCLIIEIARKAGHLPLGTFDRKGWGRLMEHQVHRAGSRRIACWAYGRRSLGCSCEHCFEFEHLSCAVWRRAGFL